MTATKRYCADCIHFCPATSPKRFDLATCKVPRDAGALGLVSPEAVTPPRFCETERGTAHPDYCGKEGKWWMPAPDKKPT